MDQRSSTVGRRHALVIGIDSYPLMNADPLRGCVQDARLISQTLAEQFAFDEIQLLLDREATRSAILNALARLLVRVEHDATVVVHFSGHGSQVRWNQGFAESLVPHDSGRHGYPNRDIVDLEIASWLEAMAGRTRYVTLIVDSCHAAGITRSGLASRLSGIRRADPDLRSPEAQDRPALAPWVSAGSSGQFRGAKQAGGSGWLPWSDRYTLIAGCKADQRACELEVPGTGVFHGALSYFLVQELLRARGKATWRDVFELAALRVSAHFPHQHPQLEGVLDREVFACGVQEPEPFAPVLEIQEEIVVLGVGAVHGVISESTFDVYPPGTHRFRRRGSLGQVVVEKVEAARSRARVLHATTRIPVGGRAFLTERPCHAPRLRVHVTSDEENSQNDGTDASPIDEIAKDLALSPFLCLAPDPQEPWDAEVRLRSPGSTQPGSAKPDGEVGHDLSFSRAVWLVQDPSGGLLMPPRLATSPAVGKPLRRQLESWARYRALVDLQPLATGDSISQALELNLLRRDESGTWQPPATSSSGQKIFKPGDRLAVVLRHHHSRPLYVAIFNLGLSGAIRLLHPMPGHREPLQPGQLLEIGKRQVDVIEVVVPDAFPFAGNAFQEGQEILKIIATEEDAPFDLLTQEGVRRDRSSVETPLTRLLSMALEGEPERSVESLEKDPGKPWTTLECGFLIRSGVYPTE